MAGLGGMNVGNAFGGVPQNAGTTQQGSTLQTLPGMGTSTAQQTQQSVAQTPSALGYTPRQNPQNVFGYNMGRLASAMDPSATLPFYNQYPSPYYRQPQQNVNPYQGVTDILGSLGSFFNESIAPTFQSAYDQQFQNFQNQLNQMSQRFAAPPPPPPPPTPDYMSELQALRQEIARIQAPTPAPQNPLSSVSGLYQNILGREGEQAGLNYWNQRFGDTIEPNEIEEFRRAAAQELTRRGQTPTPAPSVQTPTPAPSAQDNLSSVSNLYQNILGREGEQAGLDYWNQRFGDTIEPNEVAEFRRAAAQELGMDPYMRAGGVVGKYAGGGEIPSFDASLNSGAASNLISSGERVQDLGPGYRKFGVLPGNVTEQTIEGLYRDVLGRVPENAEVSQYWQGQFGPFIDLDEISQFRKAAQPELNIRRGTNEDTSNAIAQKGPGGEELTYRNGVLGYYRDAEPGEYNPFSYLGAGNQNYDPQTRKLFVPFSGARLKKGGMVHNGMSNRLKHMLK